ARKHGPLLRMRHGSYRSSANGWQTPAGKKNRRPNPPGAAGQHPPPISHRPSPLIAHQNRNRAPNQTPLDGLSEPKSWMALITNAPRGPSRNTKLIRHMATYRWHYRAGSE